MSGKRRHGRMIFGVWGAWLAALPLIVPAAGEARAAQCPALTLSPEVDVQIDEGPVRLDHTQSRASIQGMSTGSRAEPLPGTFRTAGLTRYSFEIRPALEARSIQHPGGGTCTLISRLKVVMRYREQVIYLPADYAKGSCQYGVILNHEQQHVEINRQTLREYGVKMRTTLRDFAMMQTHALYAPPGRGDGTQALLTQMKQVAQPVLDAYVKANRERNAMIDTRREYEALSRLCPQW